MVINNIIQKREATIECTHVCCTIIVEQRTAADPVGTVWRGGGGLKGQAWNIPGRVRDGGTPPPS